MLFGTALSFGKGVAYWLMQRSTRPVSRCWPPCEPVSEPEPSRSLFGGLSDSGHIARIRLSGLTVLPLLDHCPGTLCGAPWVIFFFFARLRLDSPWGV